MSSDSLTIPDEKRAYSGPTRGSVSATIACLLGAVAWVFYGIHWIHAGRTYLGLANFGISLFWLAGAIRWSRLLAKTRK